MLPDLDAARVTTVTPSLGFRPELAQISGRGAVEPAENAGMSTNPASNPAGPAATHRNAHVHEIRFVSYPKLLFIWPMIVAGFLFYFVAGFAKPSLATPEGMSQALRDTAARIDAASGGGDSVAADGLKPESASHSSLLETLGWIYIFITLLVLLTLGVDVDRNQAVFWVVLFGLFWILGLWLRDVKGITVFGNIYNWFDGLNVQYNRNLGISLSIVMLVPYLLMIFWARLNSQWRITHNEFEHYSFGKMDDSLGRGAKTIRSTFPDVFEMLLGMAGTLIVYNASGQQELRRIPQVLFLPVVRAKLNKILERTAITTHTGADDEEEAQM